MELNENEIQNILFGWLDRQMQYKNIVPNWNGLFEWEPDLIACTRAGHVVEYEIKTSRADFKADFHKFRKHKMLNTRHTPYIPSRFYYVINGFELKDGELPDYAGLIKVSEITFSNNVVIRPRIIKQAPRLSHRKLNSNEIHRMNTSLYFRYWSERKKNGTRS